MLECVVIFLSLSLSLSLGLCDLNNENHLIDMCVHVNFPEFQFNETVNKKCVSCTFEKHTHTHFDGVFPIRNYTDPTSINNSMKILVNEFVYSKYKTKKEEIVALYRHQAFS